MPFTPRAWAGLAAGLLLVSAPVSRSDDYTRTEAGSFSDTNWYDNTTNMPPPQGPPGGGDTAALNDYDVTASGGSVMMLGGDGSLTVTGSFTATTAGSFTLKGSGTCNATTCSFIDVEGGHLSTQNDTGKVIQVASGGVETAQSVVSGTGGSVSSGGSLVLNSTATDLNLSLETGGTLRAPTLTNGLSVTLTIDGAGSAATIDGDFSVAAGFLDISNCGGLTVSGKLTLDGSGNVGGGGNWTGAGTTISTSETMFVGNSAPSPGFALSIGSGAVVDSGNAEIGAETGAVGTVYFSGTGTLWEVQSGGMAIGQDGTGDFEISTGAHLLLDSGTLFAVGLDSGSTGTLPVDGAGSLVDASQAAAVSIGQAAGSKGTVTLTNGATFMAGTAFAIGDAGNGSLFVKTGSKVAATSTADLLVGSQAGSVGFLSLQDSGSSVTLSGSAILGDSGSGYLSMGTGGQLIFPAGSTVNLILGNAKGSFGQVYLSGADFTDNAPILIGKSGAGTFDATLGSAVQMPGFTAPYASGAQATIMVDQSDWVNTYNIYLGTLVASDPPSTLVVQNGGTMRVGQRMTIFQSGSATIDATSMMAVGSGAFGPAGSVRVSTGGILSGYGRVNGKVIVGAGGEIFPGNSPGLLTVGGTYEQDAGSTYSAEIGGTTVGSGYDQISVTGAATLGGTLRVRLVNGFTPTVNQTFRVVNAASATGAFATISPPSQAGISLTTDATGVTVKITSVVAGAPVISSATTVNAVPGAPFSYQIAATNNPTSFGATNLPAGLTVNNSTGLLSGTPNTPGTFVVPINANNAAGSGQADLTINLDPVFGALPLPPSNLLNISTRLDVETGDNVLIGGFIITGTDPKEVLVRGIGPSLGAAGLTGLLADPVLELHEPDGTVVTNNNWKDTQMDAIIATGIPPTNNLESAIVATLVPGAYTAILQGNNGGTGVGLVEAYDLNPTANSQLANISTRGLVQTDNNVMIGGFIVGGGGGGASTIVARAIGPSLGPLGVANPLQDPTLELHDSSGTVIAFDDNWKDSQEAEIEAAHLAPTDDRESAIEATLAPGAYTAIVRGVNGTTGVGLVEAYNIP